MFSTHSPPLLVRVLVLSVSIHSLPKICDLIVVPQVFSPVNVVVSGIGVLLLVSIILDLSVVGILTLAFVRRLKM
jgi:hypothetical protein